MSDPKTQELLPCPFCGGDAEITGAQEAGNNAFVVCCYNCMASSAVVFAAGESPEPRLVDFWNTRAPIKPKSGGVNLFLTRGEADALSYAIKSAFPASFTYEGRLLEGVYKTIQSQSKESSNDS